MNTLGIRLQQARKAAGLSLRALSDLVDLSHAAIKKYEDGVVYPSSDVLIRLARALKVRVDFFFRPIKVNLENVKFRKRKKLKGKSEEAIKFAVINQIERRLELENLYPSSPVPQFEIPANLPQKIHNLEEIESIAQKLRAHWKLGLAPIHDLIDAFENQGIRVFIIDTDEEYFDGLSTVINSQPFIVVSSKWPGDRQRFNLAHEFAHYILSGRLSSKLDEEQACNRFAGAFLFPQEVVFQTVGKQRRAIEWQELLSFKEQFQLSMSAICYRLKDLKVIQESYYTTLMIRYRQKGWHRKEPGLEMPSEKAHTFNQMLFHALGEEYIGESKAAELLSCSLMQLKALRQVQSPHASSHKRC
ncbi:MAG: ImmA/IrrE family metallo-endopeptidase [Verrucomicrobia bacterium]|nr:ImmA/IrrE family metallo-endopeptidase [Verrucomicrobiota bacterium]